LNARRDAGRPARAWIATAAALAVLALAGSTWPAATLDWQPALAAREPWRAFTAVAVHYSTLHLAANLAGAAALAVLGWAAAAPPAWAVAWLAAWPLTHLGLLCAPELAHYGGLSGVLHAGAAIVAIGLLGPDAARGAGAMRRWIGAALLAGLALKLLHEAPWQAPLLRHPPGWDIAVAPLAHLTGAAAGLLCALALRLRGARPRAA